MSNTIIAGLLVGLIMCGILLVDVWIFCSGDPDNLSLCKKK